ncbi:hypothetical protein HDU93_001043, partial [Gonapodya sp. JEL0774]
TAGLILGNVLMELPCYADYCIEHVQPMAKTSSRVALLVFYGWIVVGCAIASFLNRNRDLQRKLSNPFIITKYFGVYSVKELLVVLWLASLFSFNFGYFTAFFWTMMTGKLCDVSLGLLLLFAVKNSGYQRLLGVSFERYVWVHRGVGYFLWIVLGFHTILYIVFTLGYRTLENLIWLLFTGGVNPVGPHTAGEHAPGWGQGNWMVTMGTYSTIVFLPVALFSIPYFRRDHFNLFYYTHFLVFPALVFAWLHAASDFYYCIPGLGLYAYDLFLRTVAWNRPIKIIKAVQEPSGLMRVDFVWPLDLKPTTTGSEWGLFNVPAVSRSEWHPFSFSHKPGGPIGTILFEPKPHRSNEWEHRLSRRLLLSDASKDRESSSLDITLRLDGPFGRNDFNQAKTDCVLCFAAGTGLAPAVGTLRYAIQRLETSPKSVKLGLFWSLRGSGGEQVSVVQELMQEAQETKSCELDCMVFNSSSGEKDDKDPLTNIE